MQDTRSFASSCGVGPLPSWSCHLQLERSFSWHNRGNHQVASWQTVWNIESCLWKVGDLECHLSFCSEGRGHWQTASEYCRWSPSPTHSWQRCFLKEHLWWRARGWFAWTSICSNSLCPRQLHCCPPLWHTEPEQVCATRSLVWWHMCWIPGQDQGMKRLYHKSCGLAQTTGSTPEGALSLWHHSHWAWG